MTRFMTWPLLGAWSFFCFSAGTFYQDRQHARVEHALPADCAIGGSITKITNVCDGPVTPSTSPDCVLPGCSTNVEPQPALSTSCVNCGGQQGTATDDVLYPPIKQMLRVPWYDANDKEITTTTEPLVTTLRDDQHVAIRSTSPQSGTVAFGADVVTGRTDWVQLQAGRVKSVLTDSEGYPIEIEELTRRLAAVCRKGDQ